MKKVNLFPSKLWHKQVYYFLILAAVIIFFIQVLFNYFLQDHLSAYVSEREKNVNEHIINSFISYYDSNRDWSGCQQMAWHVSLSTNTKLVMFAPHKGRLIFYSDPLERQMGMMHRHRDNDVNYPPEKYHYNFMLRYEDEAIGELFITHLDREKGIWEEQDIIFQNVLTNSLLWTGTFAAAAALLLSIFFSRRLSSPLEEITLAVEKIDKGKLNHRLPEYNAEEFSKLSHSFNNMASNLQKLEALRKRSTADLSHELRTPLTSLRSYFEAFSEGVLEPDKETLNALYEEILHLNRIVTDLDELSWAENKSWREIKREELELTRVLKDKFAFLQPLFQEKDIKVELDLPQEAVTVNQDPKCLGKIIGNLLTNACRYTPQEGSVQVALYGDSTKVEEELKEGKIFSLFNIPVETLQQMVVVKVSDTGEGIEEKHLPFIFERFFRVDSSRERFEGGSGIGLALVKELVRLCEGEIKVKSEPGRGTTFYLYLPL